MVSSYKANSLTKMVTKTELLKITINSNKYPSQNHDVIIVNIDCTKHETET